MAEWLCPRLWHFSPWAVFAGTCGVVAVVWAAGLLGRGPGRAGGAWPVWANSMKLAGAASVTALGLALPVAWLLGGARRWLAGIVSLSAACVLLMPPYVYAYAWDLVTMPQSYLGRQLAALEESGLPLTYGGVRAWWVLSLWVWPVAAIWLGHVLAGQGRWLVAHGLLDGSRRQVMFRLVLPAFWPHLLGAGGVMAMLVLTEFGVPHLYGVPVVATELLARWESAEAGPVQAVAWLSLPSGMVGIAAGVLVARSLGRVRAAPGDIIQPEPGGWARAGWTAAGISAGVLGLSVVWPVAALVGGLSDRVGLKDLLVFWPHLKTTPWVAGVAALCCVHVGLATWRGRHRWRRWVLVVGATLSATLPAALVGAAVATAYRPFPAITDTAWMVMAVCIARFSVIMIVIGALALAAMPREYLEMAQLDGAGYWQRYWQVVVPQLWRPLVAGGVVVWALSASEVAGTGVALPPRLRWFVQLLLNQMHYSRDDTVIVGCLMLMGFVWAVGLSAYVLVGWKRLAAGRRGVA